MEKGVPIRSLSRGIAVLQAVNQAGTISMMEIARISDLPYPTACRIVQTLLYEGLIEREPARKRYRPTALVQTLAHGFRGHAQLVRTARPHLVDLTRRVGWPVSLASHVGRSMVIRDSTHSLTTLTLSSYYPGYAVPLLECAAGIVFLSFLPADERAGLLNAAKLLPDEVTLHVIDLFENHALAEQVATQGYATRAHNTFTRNPGKTSSIAVPIMGPQRVAGTLTLAFFARALRMTDAVATFLAPLQETARTISAGLAEETTDYG